MWRLQKQRFTTVFNSRGVNSLISKQHGSKSFCFCWVTFPFSAHKKESTFDLETEIKSSSICTEWIIFGCNLVVWIAPSNQQVRPIHCRWKYLALIMKYAFNLSNRHTRSHVMPTGRMAKSERKCWPRNIATPANETREKSFFPTAILHLLRKSATANRL